MKHNLTISVSKDPRRGGIVQCQSISIREKLLTKLLGRKQKLMITPAPKTSLPISKPKWTRITVSRSRP